jgi:hypothetical protein
MHGLDSLTFRNSEAANEPPISIARVCGIVTHQLHTREAFVAAAHCVASSPLKQLNYHNIRLARTQAALSLHQGSWSSSRAGLLGLIELCLHRRPTRPLPEVHALGDPNPT